MLVLLRLGLGLALVHVVRLAYDNAQSAPATGDIANAGYLALALLLALANAAVWAPFLGAKISAPLTGVITESTYVEEKNHLLKAAEYFRARGARRMAIFYALLEGVRRPDNPSAFLLGLRCARRGSRLERIFAAEVWRFDNLRHCAQAFEVLKRHGYDPRPHSNPEVNLALASLERRPTPVRGALPVQPNPKPSIPQRDGRIRLFDGADKTS